MVWHRVCLQLIPASIKKCIQIHSEYGKNINRTHSECLVESDLN